jgi:FHS family L-fucose permease-like MFS transporter
MLITRPNPAVGSLETPTEANRGALATVTTLFFMWGFLTSLNDVLIPHLKSIFALNYAEAMLVQVAFFTAYAVFGLPSGKLVERIGYQRTMVVGLLIMGMGAIMFIPAADKTSFRFFLCALTVLAAGITTLQVAANPYVSILGPERTASSRLNLAQAFNSLGTTIAPLFGGWLILGKEVKRNADVRTMSGQELHAYRLQQAAVVKLPYLWMTCALLALAIAISLRRFPRLDVTREYRTQGALQDSIFRHRNVVLGIGAIFLYVGAEVSIGSFLINYFGQSAIGSLRSETSAKLVAFYWGGAMLGRFVGSALLQKIGTKTLLSVCAIIAALLVVTSILSAGPIAIISILAVGLFNSIMFPSIFALGIADTGPLTGKASGLLVAGIVGGAIVPLVEGTLADRIGIHHAFVVPVICYLYIAYYGHKGSLTVSEPRNGQHV